LSENVSEHFRTEVFRIICLKMCLNISVRKCSDSFGHKMCLDISVCKGWLTPLVAKALMDARTWFFSAHIQDCCEYAREGGSP